MSRLMQGVSRPMLKGITSKGSPAFDENSGIKTKGKSSQNVSNAMVEAFKASMDLASGS